jgi:hypothetical protein
MQLANWAVLKAQRNENWELMFGNPESGYPTGSGQLGRDSPIFLQFFYLFSIFFLNCF